MDVLMLATLPYPRGGNVQWTVAKTTNIRVGQVSLYLLLLLPNDKSKITTGRPTGKHQIWRRLSTLHSKAQRNTTQHNKAAEHGTRGSPSAALSLSLPLRQWQLQLRLWLRLPWTYKMPKTAALHGVAPSLLPLPTPVYHISLSLSSWVSLPGRVL